MPAVLRRLLNILTVLAALLLVMATALFLRDRAARASAGRDIRSKLEVKKRELGELERVHAQYFESPDWKDSTARRADQVFSEIRKRQDERDQLDLSLIANGWPSPVARLWLYFAVWLLVATLVASVAVRLWDADRRKVRRHLGLCPSCGYDLRATPGRCPECGHQPSPVGKVSEV
jgi:Flp pilus assembly protein TadB